MSFLWRMSDILAQIKKARAMSEVPDQVGCLLEEAQQKTQDTVGERIWACLLRLSSLPSWRGKKTPD